MFTADLSWTDPTDEKVGERRERLARERSGSSKSPSVRSSESEGSEGWAPPWSSKRSRTTSNTSRGSDQSRKPSFFGFRPPDVPPKDSPVLPARVPARRYCPKSSVTVPSGAYPPNDVLPELEGDLWARRSNSSRSHSRNGSSEVKSPFNIQVIDEVHQVQQLSPRSFVARTTRRSSEIVNPEHPYPLTPVQEQSQEDVKCEGSSYSVEIVGSAGVKGLKLDDDEEVDEGELARIENCRVKTNGLSAPVVDWRPPSTLGVGLLSEQGLGILPIAIGIGVAVSDNDDAELTHFQRFIRRMQTAGPKIILDRLNERWGDDNGNETDEELKLEKQLWILTALQLQRLDKAANPSQRRLSTLLQLPRLQGQGKILELYGNPAEVYQLSAMQPREQIHYLSTKSHESIHMPDNVSYLTVPHAGITPFPYAAGSFKHIRASTLPSLVASSKLPQVFKECNRLLAPGGILEIRLMDAFSDRGTTGPRMRAWIEDRLTLNLEKSFRCSRPCLLIPSWVSEAGFRLLSDQPKKMTQILRIPCAYDQKRVGVNEELSSLVGRALWRDIWGDFVDDVPGEPRWWWEDKEVVKECLERMTFFECGTIFAVKE